ncbi:MAG TPA: fumarylacetoacetate hydrolase family protein [Opitutaceae bacterium]|nr:fumarylacetoacetate hydrolase family protein [Opitutaceae bacterium]
MRLIRHLTASGPAYAALDFENLAVEIEGDPFQGGVRLTQRRVTLGKRLAPVSPVNILGIGLNYRKHAEEGGKGVPARPMWFMKATTATQNPGAPIVLPTTCASHKVDYEGELAIVIGKAAKNVSKENALSYVLGYTIANDVSARDWQFELGGGQFCHAKSFDTFCPLGPVLVTADEIPNPNALRLITRINGAVRQDWSTQDMVFDVATLISFLSGSRTLLPGTVILTGTPHGVGYARTPPLWLAPGDTAEVEIEKIGTLVNPVISE